jgi:hypothetical protein
LLGTHHHHHPGTFRAIWGKKLKTTSILRQSYWAYLRTKTSKTDGFDTIEIDLVFKIVTKINVCNLIDLLQMIIKRQCWKVFWQLPANVIRIVGSLKSVCIFTQTIFFVFVIGTDMQIPIGQEINYSGWVGGNEVKIMLA